MAQLVSRSDRPQTIHLLSTHRLLSLLSARYSPITFLMEEGIRQHEQEDAREEQA